MAGALFPVFLKCRAAFYAISSTLLRVDDFLIDESRGRIASATFIR